MFGAKLCILVSVISIFGSPKQMQLFALISKGVFKNIFAYSNVEWEQCEVALHKVAFCTRQVEGCPCANLPCQRVLGLNCVILVSIICIFGAPKTDATFGDVFKGSVQKYLHKATWVGAMWSCFAQSCIAHETSWGGNNVCVFLSELGKV